MAEMAYKKWNVSKIDKAAAVELSEETGIPSFLCLILRDRGITAPEDADEFIDPKHMDLNDPFLLKDMDRAVERIKTALDNGEKIAVYGDYDADGVTATTLIFSFLEANGADVVYYIPSRSNEGYGMHCESIKMLAEQGVKLIVTVDNGISAIEEVAFAASLGIDVVVTDHHKPSDTLPEAYAVVDPHRDDDESGYDYLAGVGVAFKLVCALDEENSYLSLATYSDLLAVGTVADIVPLVGENRCYVVNGISSINSGDRPGLKSLIKTAGADKRELTAGMIAFTVAPRINAAGRVYSAEKAIKLLLSDDEYESNELAETIENDNVTRQELEQRITKDAERIFAEKTELLLDRVIVIDGEGWHDGIIGIVAARLTEKYGKPCIVITREQEVAKGSARSVAGFSLYDALDACKEHLVAFGGHTLAAGLSVKPENIDTFRKAINDYARENFPVMPSVPLNIVCAINPEKLSVDIVELIQQMAPFGAANPVPIFMLRKVTLKKITPIGSGKHLRLEFKYNNTVFTALKFSMMPEEFAYHENDLMDLAVVLEKNEYMNNVTVSVQIKDMKLSESNRNECIRINKLCESVLRGESIESQDAKSLCPNRQMLVALYKYLKKNSGFSGSIDVLAYRLKEAMNYGNCYVSLLAMKQSGLITMTDSEDNAVIKMVEVEGKTDLENSDILRRIRAFV